LGARLITWRTCSVVGQNLGTSIPRLRLYGVRYRFRKDGTGLASNSSLNTRYSINAESAEKTPLKRPAESSCPDALTFTASRRCVRFRFVKSWKVKPRSVRAFPHLFRSLRYDASVDSAFPCNRRSCNASSMVAEFVFPVTHPSPPSFG